jgi:hypothetical protein
MSPALRIAFMTGFWLSLCSGPFAQNLMNNPTDTQFSVFTSALQMAQNHIISERVKALGNSQAIDEYKIIRQAWEEAFGVDVWYPYFRAKKLEDSVKKKLRVKIFKLKGEPQIEKNRVSYAFKTPF